MRLCYNTYMDSRVNASEISWISPQNEEAVQPEFRRIVAQMVAPPPHSAIFIYLYDAFTLTLKKYAKFCSKFCVEMKANA